MKMAIGKVNEISSTLLVSSKFNALLKMGMVCSLLLLSTHAFADGVDLLDGTAGDLIQTVKGTGKTYLYIAELITASVGFIKTRSPNMFLGILALSVGFNVLLKIAGV